MKMFVWSAFLAVNSGMNTLLNHHHNFRHKECLPLSSTMEGFGNIKQYKKILPTLKELTIQLRDNICKINRISEGNISGTSK